MVHLCNSLHGWIRFDQNTDTRLLSWFWSKPEYQMRITLIISAIAWLSQSLCAQSKLTEHTLRLDSAEHVAAATIDDFAWLAGRWEGTGFGGIVEEVWSPPLGGDMVGTFRMIKDGASAFYEMLLLTPDSNTITYKLKHFGPDFTGWEEKDGFITFRLVKATPDALYFHGLTLKREGDRCKHYIAMKQQDGSHREALLEYQRRDQPGDSSAKEFLASVPEISQVPLLILGSYHMSNPGADMFNLKADDVSTDTRQQEINAITNRLALWNPTKIAIESPFGDSATVAQYKAYLRGAHELRNSEEEQIGFRLAKQLGHETIYPIDVKMGLNNDALEEVIASDPAKYGPYMQELQEIGKAAITQIGQWLSTGTIGSVLYQMNSKEMNDLSHAIYFRNFLPLVRGDDYAGADLVSTWYQRNLRIISNLHPISDSPDDRILIISGQGHAPLFHRFAEDSPYFRVDNVRTYLKGL
jgi:hypothetical protein